MIYRVHSRSREYFLTGPPGADIADLYKTFLSKLDPLPANRTQELRLVLAALAPDEVFDEQDPEGQVFVHVLEDSLGMQRRELIAVSLAG